MKNQIKQSRQEVQQHMMENADRYLMLRLQLDLFKFRNNMPANQMHVDFTNGKDNDASGNISAAS